MDVATALAAAQMLFSTLHCAEVRKLCSKFKYKSEYQNLLNTVETIKSVLLDADSKCQELTNEGQNWVENLKDAVYAAEDLFDEFNTIARQQKRKPDRNISKKVRNFFSSNNKLTVAFNTSREIKKLREKLDDLAKKHRDFGLRDLYKPVKSREETCSYVYEQSIIGREADKEVIVDLLLQDDLEKNISFVTIVGIGGLGKTALAQLVFSDLRIKEAFQKMMYWVCVSDNFSTKYIIGKMLGMNELVFEDLQKKFRQQIEGERYLLVLDDVWNENGLEWDKLRNFLILGGRGSRILVTSRSHKVADAIGKYPIHHLQGLSEKDSWELFEKISLAHREDQADTELVEIGKDILKKCANVPLSIRVIASLLQDQHKATWQSFKSTDLAKMCYSEDDLMPTLMFSYYHLAPELKGCFSFCSLFPQDYVIEKEVLISMWSAQGYLVPNAANKDESMEDVGEKYLSTLLHRCFFQDVIKDEFGDVRSFKMHDLIHDLARKVAGNESLVLTTGTKVFQGIFRHLSMHSVECAANWLGSSYCSSETLRSCVNYDRQSWKWRRNSNVDAIISNGRRLRVLDLKQYVVSRTLPDTLGKLLHLRHLDLSNSYELEMLPESVTKLHNLQTLKLVECEKLKELPKDTSKLVNLRVLEIKGCSSLAHMPAGMDKLTCLRTLSMFVVRVGDGSKQDKRIECIDLEALNKLRGILLIKHYLSSDKVEDCNPPSIKLKALKLRYEFASSNKVDEASLDLFLPNKHNFREMEMDEYRGTEFPSWASMVTTSLQGLVRIHLCSCINLQHLPSSMSQLCHLKHLRLEWMRYVEYIESDAPSPSAKFFPSLEELVLRSLPKLKGWWRDIKWMEKEGCGGCLVDGNEQPVFIPTFSNLRDLSIKLCSNMTYFPPSPHLKELDLKFVNEALTFCMKRGIVQSRVNEALSSNLSVTCILEKLTIEDSRVFSSLFREFVAGAVYIEFLGRMNLEVMREGFQSCVSSLQHLTIDNYWNYSPVSLEELLASFKFLKTISCRGSLEGIPWKSLHSLQSLRIENDYKLQSLPEAMRYLTSLTTLEIEWCHRLKSLPEAMLHLTSLTTLTIVDACKELYDRCQDPYGEDWHKICHIAHLHISQDICTQDWIFAESIYNGKFDDSVEECGTCVRRQLQMKLPEFCNI